MRPVVHMSLKKKIIIHSYQRQCLRPQIIPTLVHYVSEQFTNILVQAF